MSADDLAPFIRILLRYGGPILVHAGYAHNPQTFADPDVIQVGCYVAAACCVLVSEGWYVIARKRGWRR